jgi:hypothetical protein
MFWWIESKLFRVPVEGCQLRLWLLQTFDTHTIACCTRSTLNSTMLFLYFCIQVFYLENHDFLCLIFVGAFPEHLFMLGCCYIRIWIENNFINLQLWQSSSILNNICFIWRLWKVFLCCHAHKKIKENSLRLFLYTVCLILFPIHQSLQYMTSYCRRLIAFVGNHACHLHQAFENKASRFAPTVSVFCHYIITIILYIW